MMEKSQRFEIYGEYKHYVYALWWSKQLPSNKAFVAWLHINNDNALRHWDTFQLL